MPTIRQAPNNSNEAKIVVAVLTVVKFIYSEKTRKIEEISLLKVGSEEIDSSPCKCSPLLSLTFLEIKKSFT